MSQVKNLRAMFENKGDDASPPDRGRSPAPSGSSTPGASFAGSPRPLSRIRSSFVAIEKDGRMGLQRTTSDEGSFSRRRMSGDTDADSISVLSDSRSVTTPGDESAKPIRRMFIDDPIPESPRLPKDLDGSSHDIGAVTDQPSVNPDKQLDEEQPKKNLLPADPMTATKAGEPVEAAPEANTPNGISKPTTGSASTKTSATTAPKKTTTRPAAISTKSAAKAAPSAKSPATTKTPTSATSTAKAPVKTTARTAIKKEPAAASTRGTASTATKPTASSVMKKPAALKPSTSGTGFVKPKVKSPTKPVNLPSSLMAPTASSGAKGNAPRQSLTAQSGNAQPRASSRAGATTGAAKYPKAPVSKNPRPSIGPPPKRASQDKPAARESNVDEGFLARMMRPTAASAQKTAEKTAVTPPRRTAGRPSTTSSRRESSVRSSSRAKSPSIHASATSDEPKMRTHSIDEIAVETAIAETVEEVADAAHEADLAPAAEDLPADAPAVDAADLPEDHIEPAHSGPDALADVESIDKPDTAGDAVLETAVVETAEEAAELAEEVDQVQMSAEDEPTSTVEEAALEAATAETAEEVEAVAEEAHLVQTPPEPETAESALTKEDEVAVETANIDTAESAAAIAEEGDLIQTSVEPVSIPSKEELEPSLLDSKADSADFVENLPAKVNQDVPAPDAVSDIDLLAEKLAGTRIEAGEEKAIDEDAKETR